MADDSKKKTTFQMYNPDSQQNEEYPMNQSTTDVLYENATLTDTQSQKLHAFRLKNGWRTQDPMTGKIYNGGSDSFFGN